MINIQAMVNRKDQLGNTYQISESIGIIESIWLITKGINYVSAKEIIPDQLNVGDKANFVVLNHNLQNINKNNVHKLAIDTIIKDGCLLR